ncbi:3-hydroxy-3-methylglutaryl-CoA reductase [Sporocytophaga myxococcoides]|uniref:hydroxymethylglutaryl-CoA reductase (NADPH) n=1 Tax=Sporocytophaga myxococcoides TaxID=153721 RepID=A0A098LK50_9BACT|nr:hydroxymethylglutaryl-CoA reductase [Sporocytophaga myxococcoides]GAL87361.1 3-hydroxy-3-methylglutaryl-CoA reductase [Sporocytophaga myxococcoides]
MASSAEKTRNRLKNIGSFDIIEKLKENLNKNSDTEKDRLPIELKITEEGTTERRNFIYSETGKTLPLLYGEHSFNNLNTLEGNIENFIGMSMIPTGVIGPLRVTGTDDNGDFYIPLATSEGALVASYHRGAKACYLAGGATSICLVEGVQRSPVFKFNTIVELGSFLSWVLPLTDHFRHITENTSRYAKLIDLKANIEGNHLILIFEYSTGDAAGQNMVTLCTDEICQYILEHAPVKPEFWFIESNYSGDKKATAYSFSNVRGKKVTAEIILPESIITSVLKTTARAMAEYWRTSTVGVIQSGAIGAQGHIANGLTALFIATGQDVACISEAAVGITRMEEKEDGALYASVTLPNLIVGTVGGGTALPTQKECLELMDCAGEGKARKFAEICGAVVLAGELSIAAALSSGHFTGAHKKLGRKKVKS